MGSLLLQLLQSRIWVASRTLVHQQGQQFFSEMLLNQYGLFVMRDFLQMQELSLSSVSSTMAGFSKAPS